MKLFNFPEWNCFWSGGDQAGTIYRLKNGPKEYILCYQRLSDTCVQRMNEPKSTKHIYWINNEKGITLISGNIPEEENPERYAIKMLEEFITK